jgi:hypothetical protein
MRKGLRVTNVRSLRTVIKRAGLVDGRDERHIGWDRRHQVGVVREGSETLEVVSELVGERECREMSTH